MASGGEWNASSSIVPSLWRLEIRTSTLWFDSLAIERENKRTLFSRGREKIEISEPLNNRKTISEREIGREGEREKQRENGGERSRETERGRERQKERQR